MRNRFAPIVKSSKNKRRIQYDFQSRSDSNGPMEFTSVTREKLGAAPFRHYVKKVKPYAAANANGIVRVGGVPTSVTNSAVLYQFMEQHPDILQKIKDAHPYNGAVNQSIKSAQSYGDILLLVSAAEAKKTASMLRSVFINLYEFIFGLYKAVRHLKPKEAYNILSDAWLSYRYGWTPLGMELQALAKNFVDTKLFHIRSAYGGNKYTDVKGLRYIREISFISENYSSSMLVTLNVSEVIYRAGFNYVNSETSRNNDSFSRLGLDFKSVLSTAWELIPFSFILDMFINIGDCLTAFDVKTEVNPFNGYLTTKLLCGVTYKFPTFEMSSKGIEYRTLRRDSNIRDWLGPGPATYYAAHNDMYKQVIPDFAHCYVAVINVEPIPVQVVNTGTPYYKDVDTAHGYNFPDGSLNLKGRGHFFERREYRWKHTDGSYRYYVTNVPASLPDEVLEPFGEDAPFGLAVDQQIQALWLTYNSFSATKKKSFFGNSLRERFFTFAATMGVCPLGHKVITDVYGTRVEVIDYDLRARIVKIFPYRSIPRKFESDPVDDEPQIFSGEHLTREDFDSFEFKLIADTDLSKSQAADLVIFGERLVTAVRSRLK